MTPQASYRRRGRQAGTAPAGDRVARGKSRRGEVARSRHGEWAPASDREDPLAILLRQEDDRVAELVAIRHGRMASSEFAFFRGAAVVMAADLGREPHTGLLVQLCGDAHLVNFGGFASPERDLVFDVNDFDETLPGPFEWDLKRLAASLEVAGRERGFDPVERATVVASAARSYRESIRELAGMRMLDIWYAKLDRTSLQERWGAEAGPKATRRFRRLASKATTKNHLKAFDRLTRVEDGRIRFVSDPPLLEPIDQLFDESQATQMVDSMLTALSTYRRSLPTHCRRLLDRYRYVDLARKVVGVGSVGTRCWVALFVGHHDQDPLFLQIKEAEPSVLEPHLTKSRFSNQGQRVVEGQRMMQAASDIMLGWGRTAGLDGRVRDFYVRQLWDWKVSGNVEVMAPPSMAIYAEMCGWTLARAHARSGDALTIGAYLGSGAVMDEAMVRFARAYAEQNARDHRSLVEAIRDGRVAATHNL